MMMATKKRRKAIECKLVSESKTSPGYFKYLITIEEVNGDVYDVPAYGIDMQDAIKRLLAVERSEKINRVYVNKVEPITLVTIALGWFAAVMVSAITNNYQYALYGVVTMFTIVTAFLLIRFFNNK